MISPSLSPALGSGIHGTVLAGPTCPVERLDSPCPPRPVAATIEAETAGGQIVATADSGAGGTYTLTLPPGSYTLVVASPSPFPRCPPTPAVVASGTVAIVAIECDTGIR